MDQLDLLPRDATPATLDPQLTLEGRTVRLVPIELRHAEQLQQWVEPDRESFELVLSSPLRFADAREFISWLHGFRDAGKSVPFAVESKADGRLLGYTRYLHIDLASRATHVGGTWYCADARGTAVNPDCKLALLTHAFEQAHINRVQIETDATNTRSRRAIEKIGATYEGTLRANYLTNAGGNRDTAVYSVIRSEWHVVKPVIEGLLEERLQNRIT